MKKNQIALFIFALGLSNLAFGQAKFDLNEAIQVASSHYKNSLQINTDSTRIPRSTKADGTLKLVKSSDWCSGFFAGSLWLLYDLNHDAFWKKEAIKWTAALEKEKNNKTTHDLGFMMYNSFGNGYKNSADSNYKQIIIQSARSIASRFNPKAGVMKSWDNISWQYPVIIDNMMNLELLFEASLLSGDKEYRDIAIRHADHDMQHHFRADFSSYHLLDYDTISGMPIKKQTYQGYSDASAWGRGQAWGLYGFVTMYRYTKNKKYLDQANRIAGFILNHPNWPKDHVPYWDFNHPNIPNTVKDASAGAIIASALLELSRYVSKTEKKKYVGEAKEIVKSLSSPNYRAQLGKNNNFILMHSVGNLPAGSEIDTPISYADYYYLEALLRLKSFNIK
jgi:unsaturated chondroitin disaccharide hydrolase